MHVHELDLAHWKRAAVSREPNAEQRARTGNVILRGLLTEVLERADRRRTVLNLVENQQRLPWIDGLAGREGETRDDAPRIMRDLKELGVLARSSGRHVLQRHIDAVAIARAPKLPEGPGLPDLTGSLEHERLAMRRRLPRVQLMQDVSLHCKPSKNVLVLTFYPSQIVIIITFSEVY